MGSPATRSSPFPGYPTTEGRAIALVMVASTLAAVLLLLGLGLIISASGAYVDDHAYMDAPICQSVASGNCREVKQGVVVDAGVVLAGRRGEHYEVKVKLLDESEPVTVSSSGRVGIGMSAGDGVAVTYWHRAPTKVDDHGNVLTTADEPAEKYRSGFIGGGIFVLLGVGALLFYVRQPFRDLRSGRFRVAAG